jgi:glucose-6-phosphate isomerase
MSLDGKPPLKDAEAWATLQKYFNNNKNTINMKDMFATDQNRFDTFSIKLDTPRQGPFLVDYSKNKINEEVMRQLFNLARERGVEEARDAMFAGRLDVNYKR